MKLSQLGFWAFIIGLVLAVVAGIFFPSADWVIWVLLILGLIVGLLNISEKESGTFLLATIALIVVGNVFAPITALQIGETLDDILNLVAAFMSPAAIIVAVKALWVIGKTSER